MSSRFSVPKPCHKSWGDLRGHGRERFCDECQTAVYAKDHYSAEEWERIWSEAGGHVCGMLDGTSVPVPRSRRAVPAGALLTAMSPLMAQAGRIRVRVTDPTDGVVPGAEISLVGADYKPVQTQRADRVGEAAFTGLPMGNCRIVVSSPGFKTKSVSVVIQNGEELRVEARLEIGAITMGTIVEAMQPVTGRVRIQIKDATGMAIAAAQGSILDAAGKPTRTVPANSAGEVVFTDLPLGDCGFVVWSIGFENRRVYLSLRSADEVQIRHWKLVQQAP